MVFWKETVFPIYYYYHHHHRRRHHRCFTHTDRCRDGHMRTCCVELCVLVALLTDQLITMTLQRRPMRPLPKSTASPLPPHVTDSQVCYLLTVCAPDVVCHVIGSHSQTVAAPDK